MVAKGQFLERPALIDAGGFLLEGLYHRGEEAPSLLVCPPLGEGVGMDAPAVAELAFAAARAGRASLRFQHRGRGGSQGEVDASRTVDDAEAARRHLEECDGPQIALAAYTSGAATAIALAARVPLTRRLILVAPPPPAALPALRERLRVLAIFPEAVEPALLASWRELTSARDGSTVIVEGGPDEQFLRGLVQVGQRAMEWLSS